MDVGIEHTIDGIIGHTCECYSLNRRPYMLNGWFIFWLVARKTIVLGLQWTAALLT